MQNKTFKTNYKEITDAKHPSFSLFSYLSDKKTSAQRKGGKEKINLFVKVNEITGEMIDASIRILKRLGPGLLKSEYEKLL